MSEQTNGKGREVTVGGTRFPWVKEFEERYGIDKTQWRALTDAVFPNAKRLDSIILALSYCRARKLDVFKRPVHIVPMWSTAANDGKGGMIDTIWPGIGELRTTAVRTGQFAGRDAAVWGPDVTAKYGSAEVTHPEWCEVVVYRTVDGVRFACNGPRVYWTETYATKERNDTTPNSMWMKRPRGQLEKCADAAALRAAFPEEIGNEYCADEMEGKIIEGRYEVAPAVPAPTAVAKPAENKLAAFASEPTQDDIAVLHAAVRAVCERLELPMDDKAFKAIRKEAIPVMGRCDDIWPEGKDQITAALAAAEQSLASAGGGKRTDEGFSGEATSSVREASK